MASRRAAQGFSSDDVRPLPTQNAVLAKLRHVEMAEVFGREGIEAVMERFGLPNRRAAVVAVNRALRALNKGAIDAIGQMRALELLRLQRMTEALESKMQDPKVAAELRLQSESRRRLYGVDLQREEATPDVKIEILFETPDRRDAPEPAVDAEFEVIAPAEIEAGA